MDVYSKKVKRFEINTINELEKFIIDTDIKKHFKRFPDNIRNDVMYDIGNTERINIKMLKTSFIKKYFTCGTHFDPLYWIERGCTEDESTECVADVQRSNSNKFHTKRNKHPDKYRGWNSTHVDYWLNKGYSLSEAELKLKERQSTFSLNGLIKLYGESKASELMDDRNARWLSSLKSNNDWSELSISKGNGLSKIKTLSQHVNHYGELIGKIKFAKRYWGVTIKSIREFDEYELLLSRDRTLLFYDTDYRTLILTEQNCKCAECNIPNTDALFHLHHIDYDKRNDSRENLIFLCHSCHSKTTNSDRNKWINYYNKKNKQFYEKKI